MEKTQAQSFSDLVKMVEKLAVLPEKASRIKALSNTSLLWLPATTEEMIDSCWAECYASRPWWGKGYCEGVEVQIPRHGVRNHAVRFQRHEKWYSPPTLAMTSELVRQTVQGTCQLQRPRRRGFLGLAPPKTAAER